MLTALKGVEHALCPLSAGTWGQLEDCFPIVGAAVRRDAIQLAPVVKDQRAGRPNTITSTLKSI